MQILFAILCFVQFSKARYVTVPNKTLETAEETQHAVCKIVTDELQATANVTLTRELKGVCTSAGINLKLEELKFLLLTELRLIRQEIKEKSDSQEITKPSYRYYPEYQNDGEEAHVPQKSSSLQKRTAQNSLGEFLVHPADDFSSENRKAEILKYNATINASIKGTFFYYYWNIENVNEILSDRRGISVRSPSFTLLGQSIHILLFPHHLRSNYLGIQLKNSPKYFFKHRFTIVDHVSPRGDLSSQLLGDEKNYALMYRVAHDRVEVKNFIYGDELIIKVTITLK